MWAFLILLVLGDVSVAVQNDLFARLSSGALIDLHSHSTFSDGTDSPIELVRKAHQLNISVLAMTDHDQLHYSPEALQLATELGITIIQGTEISCEWQFQFPDLTNKVSEKVHLLGYFTQETPDSELYQLLAKLRVNRDNRNELIIAQLGRQREFHITMQQVEAQARNKEGKLEVVGRPHIAKALQAAGYVASIKEAFQKYLNDEALALPKWSLDMADTIRAVNRHGGVSVLAHPSSLNISDQALARELDHLLTVLKVPLDGVEVYSSRHSQRQADFYLALAKEHLLLVTGGSDYHGSNKEGAPLGQFGGAQRDWAGVAGASVKHLKRLSTTHQLRVQSTEAAVAEHAKRRLSAGGGGGGSESDGFRPSNDNDHDHDSKGSKGSKGNDNAPDNSHDSHSHDSHHPRHAPRTFSSYFPALFHIFKRVLAYATVAFIINTLITLSTRPPVHDGSFASTLQGVIRGNRFLCWLCSPGGGPPTGGGGGRGPRPKDLAPVNRTMSEKVLHFLLYAGGLNVCLVAWGYFQERIMTVGYGPDNADMFTSSEFLVLFNRSSAWVLSSATLWLQARRWRHTQQVLLQQQQQQQQQQLTAGAGAAGGGGGTASGLDLRNGVLGHVSPPLAVATLLGSPAHPHHHTTGLNARHNGARNSNPALGGLGGLGAEAGVGSSPGGAASGGGSGSGSGSAGSATAPEAVALLERGERTAAGSALIPAGVGGGGGGGAPVPLDQLAKPPVSSTPPIQFAIVSVSNVVSSWFQYEALKFVSFPMQLLSKSSRILFTMLMGKLVSGKKYSWSEYFLATFIMFGLALFGSEQMESGRKGDTSSIGFTIGLFLLLGWVCADSFTSTWQSKIFKTHSPSPTEMMNGVNAWSCAITFFMLVSQGTLWSSIVFMQDHPLCFIHAVLMSVAAAVSQMCIFIVIAEFGAVVFASVMTARQFFSIIVSFSAYGHSLSLRSGSGMGLVFVALILKSYWDFAGGDGEEGGGKGGGKGGGGGAGKGNKAGDNDSSSIMMSERDAGALRDGSSGGSYSRVSARDDNPAFAVDVRTRN